MVGTPVMRIRVKKIYHFIYFYYTATFLINNCKYKKLFGEQKYFFFNQKKIRGRYLKKIVKICVTLNLQVAGNFLQGFARC